MSFSEKIFIPLSNQVDTSALEHLDIFEGEGDRIALSGPGPGNIDPEASNLSQSGLVAFSASSLLDGVTNQNSGFHTDSSGAGSYLKINLGVGNTQAWGRARFYIYLAEAHAVWDIQYSDNNLDWFTAYTGFDVSGGTGWKEVSWPRNGAHRYWRFYKTDAAQNGGWHSELEMYGVPYDTTSPSPVAVWTALPLDAVIDLSTAKCWMFKDGIIQAATNTDIKFKYAINGGTLGSALTLSELRAIDLSTTPITDAINSLKAVGVYASDGSYESKSSAWLECDVEFLDGAVVGGKYDKFAKSGARRIYA